MFIGVDWSHRDAHMFDRHKITTGQAEEALADPERVVISPDYNSQSGQSTRVIGYAPSLDALLSIIIVVEDEIEYGATGFRSNTKDQHLYHGKDTEHEQDQ